MQTLLLLTIIGSLAAGDVLVPLPLVAQATPPATKSAATGKAATAKSAPVTHTTHNAGKQAASSTAPKTGGKVATAASAVRDSADGSIDRKSVV